MQKTKPFIGQVLEVRITYEAVPNNKRYGKVVYIIEKHHWFNVQLFESGLLVGCKYSGDKYLEFTEEKRPHTEARRMKRVFS